MSGLGIYFIEDVFDRLAALAQANERTLVLAESLGANHRDLDLVRAVYQGALADVGRAFGLQRPQLTVILREYVFHLE